MYMTQLIPMRFITMMGHLVILSVILWHRDNSVRACISWNYLESEYDSKDIELIIGLSISIGLLIIEFLGFMSGITMFSPMHSLFSLISHSGACITLAYFITDVWDCTLFWWIFAFCSVLPALSEILIIIRVIIFKRVI